MAPMYLEHFGLAEAPFSLAPDPRYLFLSAGHRDALAHLLYGLDSDDGFVLLTGEVGSGKTTLCRCLLEQLPAECDVALVFNPKLTVPELLATICEEFQIPVSDAGTSIKAYIDRLNAWLMEAHRQGRRAVLIVDEAQDLSPEVFEQIRLLTNLETSRHKLLRVILIGQAKLRDILDQPDMQQLAQRIVARYHLGTLSPAETSACVVHRLAVAGTRHELFSQAACEQLHRLSGGIPRRLCILADRALLGTHTQWLTKVEAEAVVQAAQEVQGTAPPGPSRSLPRAAVMGLGAAFSAAALSAAYVYYDDSAFAHPVAALAKSTAAGCAGAQ